MTTDLELNKKLALAIGWREDQIRVLADELRINDEPSIRCRAWSVFDHADWRVAGPIAQRYGLLVNFKTCTAMTSFDVITEYTPQRAIALAVIQGAQS